MAINKNDKFVLASENSKKSGGLKLWKHKIKSATSNKKFRNIRKNKKSLLGAQNEHNLVDNNYKNVVFFERSITKTVIILIVLILNISFITLWNWNYTLTISRHSNFPDGIKVIETPVTSNANANITKVIHPFLSGYIVWNDKCKIPDIEPFDSPVLKYFKRQYYKTCSPNKPFTNVQFNITTKQYTLNINETLKLKYGSYLDCCYQAIIRNQTGKYADKCIKLSNCLTFSKPVQIPNTTDNILVKCKNNNNEQVYINGHPMMPERNEIRERLDAWHKNKTKRSPSILMIGIESISRINLLRAMPKTAKKLYDNEWFEMSGYNKMDDNTFPNLMAILTGYNLSTVYNKCNVKNTLKLDNCPMIWKLFHEHGYITAFAEDELWRSTFKYLKLGFEIPPVDYYFRPFLVAAKKNLPIHRKSGLAFCLGYQHSADYVFDYAIELATRYKYQPYFGLFWVNSFNDSDIGDCSSMDIKVAAYVQELSTRGILKESVVIFFSDHGIRWGSDISGFLEDRLPFMFIWLPQWLKTKYPEFVHALRVNKNQLTNPYDIHMTLKNLLELSGRTKTNLPKATDCPNCQTLLRPVPHNRSCDDIAIEDHWCTCIPYKIISAKSKLVQKLAIFVVDYINEYVQNFKNGLISNLCSNLQLDNIVEAYQADLIGDSYPKHLERYRLVLATAPGNGLFEVTLLRKTDTGELQVIGSISRLNSYASDSKCVCGTARKYCHCSKNRYEKELC